MNCKTLWQCVRNATPADQARQKAAWDRHMRERDDHWKREGPILLKSSWSTLSRFDVENKAFESFKVTPETAEVYKLLDKWTPGQSGILLYGPVGNGKTHLLKSVIIRWASQAYPCRFATLTTLFDSLRANLDSTDGIMHEYFKPELLVLDDFGVDRGSEFEQSKLLTLLDKRIQAGKPVFLSSNLNIEQLCQKYDMRVIDRLREMMVFKSVKGESYRKRIQSQHIDRWRAAKDKPPALEILQDDRKISSCL